MSFKPLEILDLDTIRPYFEKIPYPNCDFSVGGVFLWRDYYKTEYAIIDNTLILKYINIDKKEVFSLPIGENVGSAIGFIKDNSKDKNELLFSLPKQAVSVVTDCFKENKTEISDNRDWYDYLYDAESFITFKGKKFSAKRNHINKFNLLYPDYTIKVMDKSDIPAVAEFLKTVPENHQSELSKAEEKAFERCLDEFDIYRFKGLILSVDGKIIALAIGDVIGKTLYEHFEKANTDFEGSYTVIAHEFAKAFGKDVSFIDREEDMGLEGLRKSKESYNPCGFAEKTNVKIIIK